MKKQRITDGILKIIEQSDASPKRKETTKKLLDSSYMDKLKTGAKGLGDPATIQKMMIKMGWPQEETEKMLPTMVATFKDGLNKMIIQGAAELAKQDGEEAEKAKAFLEKIGQKSPDYVQRVLEVTPETDGAKASAEAQTASSAPPWPGTNRPEDRRCPCHLGYRPYPLAAGTLRRRRC